MAVIPSISHQFRYASRQVLKQPSDLSLHKKRLNIAKEFNVQEPLQGAIADMLYGCWFDMPFQGMEILDGLKHKLSSRLFHTFSQHIKQQCYMLQCSKQATRWSVLVTPSMDMVSHQMRISTDDARMLADKTAKQLLHAQTIRDEPTLKNIEENYFDHCIACVDRIGFFSTWFKLSKKGWVFDERWQQCQHDLEKMTG